MDRHVEPEEEPKTAPAAGAVDWSALVRVHGARIRFRVYNVLVRLGVHISAEVIDEVEQEVYCRLLARHGVLLGLYAEGAPDPRFASCVRRIAERTAVDHVRSANARKRQRPEPLLMGRRGLEEVPDPRPTPEQSALGRENERLLLTHCRALRGLGSGRRNAWVLQKAVLEGYSSREIADAAGGRLTPRAVDNLVHRLRRRLAAEGFQVGRR